MGAALKSEEAIDKVAWYLLFALAVGLPLLVNPFGLDYFTLPKLVLLKTVVISLLFLFIARALLVKRLETVSPSLKWPWAVFLLFTLASTFFSIAPHRSLYGVYQYKEGFLVILCYALVCLLPFNFLRRREQVEWLLAGLAGSAFLVSLYGLYQHSEGFAGWRYTETRVFSTISNPVYLGAYLTLVLPVVFSFLFSSRLSFRFPGFKPVVYVSLTAILGCLLLTFTRAAWLGTFFGLGVAFYLLKGVKKERSLLVLFSLAVFIAVFLVVLLNPAPKRFLERLTSLVKVGRETETARLFLWQTSLQAIAKKPASGYGLQTFGLVYPMTRSADWTSYDTERKGSEKVHNDLLQVAVSSGLFGLLAYLWLLTTFFLTVFKRIELKKDRILVTGLVSSVSGYLLNLQFNFTMVEVTPLFWLVVGLALFLLDTPKKPLLVRRIWELPFSFSKSAIGVAAFSLGLGSIFLVFQAFQPLLADVYAAQAMKSSMKGAYGTAVAGLQQAIRLSDREIFYYQLLGSLLEQQSLIGQDQKVFEQSAGAYRAAQEIDPLNSELSLALGDLYVKGSAKFGSAQLDQAIHSYTNGLKNDPNNPVIWSRLGIAYGYQGSFESASSSMEKSIKLDSKTPDSWFNLGLLYERQGMFPEAEKSYRQALKVDPGFKDAKEGLSYLEGLKQQ